DCISPRFAIAALIAALDHRNKTGQGQLIEISQFETALSFIAPALLDYTVNRREPVRTGNSNPAAAPHGVFPCQGDDRWCAIAVSNENQWLDFCRVIDNPGLAADPRFSRLSERKKNEEELNKIVSLWTKTRTAEEVMEKLQVAGVPAGVVKNAADIYTDPQLRQRNLFWKMQHPEMGEFTHLGQGFSLSKTPAQAKTPSPLLGEHTEYICSHLLGMKDEEFAQFSGAGVFE
ncbi:MAG TPA: CoA transferase, partial [Dehalococcoidales bacterium]